MTDVKEKVGVLTDEISTAGRPIYKTPEGEMVSEKSTTFKYKGGWINIPTIHNGYSYDEEELRIMLDNNIIKPTSTHKNLKAAEKAAKERSPTLRGFNPGGSVEDQTGQAFKGMGYGEIIADNLIGLDNEYESLGEKIGKQFNQDEAAFLKKMGVSMYEGAKDFISAPIETTKEGFKEFATGTTDFLFKDLDTRLQEMFKTDYNNATPEQVTKARESVLGDAVIASGILPAGKVIGNVVEGAVDIGTNAARKIDLSKVNSAIARANEIAEDVEGKIDTSILGKTYRDITKEKMGEGKGKQNPVQTQKALNLGYSETGFHSTGEYDPKKEVEIFKLPDEIYAEKAAERDLTLNEAIEQFKGEGFNDPSIAQDFLGVHVGTTKAAAERNKDKTFYKGIMEGARTYQLKLKTNKPFLNNKKLWTEKTLNKFLVKEMDKIKDGQVYEKMQIIRRQLAAKGFTHVPYINNVEDRKNISYAMLVDRPEGGGVNSSAVIRYKDAEFNPLEKSNRNAKFAQGGVAMKDQMEMNFGKAETVDPVSGNDVPPGSLPIEVRDDIPARLSEGEYVVPADVVRYYGVKFFEDLRTGAKMGLQQMDKDGRIGGEPIEPQQTELSEEDLDSIVQQAMQEQQPIMANEGVSVGYQMPDYLKNKFAGSSVFDYNPTNKPKAADEIIEDAATPTCPSGYTYDKDKKMCMPDASSSSSFYDGSNDPDEPPTVTPSSSNPWGTTETGEFIDFADPKALAEYVNSFDTPVFDGRFNIGSDEGKLASLAGVAVPALGVVATAAGVVSQLDATRDIAGMKAARISAAIYGHEELVKKIDGIIKEYEGPKGLGSKTLGIGQGYNWTAKAHGLTTRETKEFWELWEDSQKTGATDATKKGLEKLRLKLLEKSKAARIDPMSTVNKTADQYIAKTKAYLEEKGGGEGNITPGSQPSPTTSPAPSVEDFRSSNTKSTSSKSKSSTSSSDSYGGKKDDTNYGGYTGSPGGRATGGLVQRRKKKKK